MTLSGAFLAKAFHWYNPADNLGDQGPKRRIMIEEIEQKIRELLTDLGFGESVGTERPDLLERLRAFLRDLGVDAPTPEPVPEPEPEPEPAEVTPAVPSDQSAPADDQSTGLG